MQNDHTHIRSIVEAALTTGDAAPLIELLGFGNGPRGTLACYLIPFDSNQPTDIARHARALRASDYTELQLYVFHVKKCTQIIIASYGLGEQLLTLTVQRDHLHASDIEALSEMVPLADEKGSALAARHARALDRSRVTRRFFADFAAQRDTVADAWSAPKPLSRRDREQLALLLLSRLMFLYFLQHRGYLGGDRSFLLRRFREWCARPRRKSFYAGALKPLFFMVLNRRPERRHASVAAFGALPYLNGGLFEQHHLERKHKGLDLPDTAMASAFTDLLERYRFTTREASDAELEGVHDVGVDPEMLGRVFEGLMAERVRETTGTFYTPAAAVDRLVCNTLTAYLEPRVGADASSALVREASASALDPYQRAFTSKLLRETRVLDPACGSGAFLLGSLARIAQARAALDESAIMQNRREVVAQSLYGVDVQSDAALLCALRLWLALVPGAAQQDVQPLPNLDRQIRQGDSLVDPLDLKHDVIVSDVRKRIAELQSAAAGYVTSEPEQRPALQRTLAQGERRLARAWVGALQRRIAYEATELRAAAHEKDLFGSITSAAREARVRLEAVRQRHSDLRKLAREIQTTDERPFFSYGVHFADAALDGFNIILCNPPWIRSHNWPRAITKIVRSRFEVCRANTWRPPHDGGISTGGGNQVDLALLFLERAIDLLTPGGALGIILPAKFMRSLSGAAARKLLLEKTEIVSVEDHSLDQRSIFQADAFAAFVVARKPLQHAATPLRLVEVTTVKRNAEPLRYCVPQRSLPLFAGDARAPWLLVPSDVRRALARMGDGPLIGAHRELHVRRGIVTGRNDVMILSRVDRKIGDLATVRSDGFAHASNPGDYEGIIEERAISKVLRGCDLSAWSARAERFVLCRTAATPRDLPRLTKYLKKHGCTPSDIASAPNVLPAVAWHDLANTLKAVVVPADVVPINTVYFIASDTATVHLLCAYFNSTPLRTYARCIAERAKDAHFRFFAWTVSMLPLPSCWRSFEAKRLREISEAAHARHGIDDAMQRELDDIVARAYALTRADTRALNEFDAWLRPS